MGYHLITNKWTTQSKNHSTKLGPSKSIGCSKSSQVHGVDKLSDNCFKLLPRFIGYQNPTVPIAYSKFFDRINQNGPSFNPLNFLMINYILGANPMSMSYVVGHGSKYPKHVHHRGASIPKNNVKYSCTGGWRWRDAKNPNPNIITGAMVGGPDKFDKFKDVRTNYSYTEPTLAGNAGLVAALVSLTSSGGHGIDKNTIFSAVPPMYPVSPPPPPPWKP